MMVVIKIAAVLVFVFGAAHAIKPEHWRPYMPNGFSGVLTGAAIVFFTYIGFDSVSCAAEETRNPQRDMPIGIIGHLNCVRHFIRICCPGADRDRQLENAEQCGARRQCVKGDRAK